ncbi:probable inactive peptidyl-prolyl cis-trans isomerase-like 6 isoform X6 [Balaenoptera musculus]|uniref:Peptidyl-prolyl cis-trans isomerase n=1 Tax=Balaenoptera musculus TaxID=9771 RepID=A0A8B8Z5X8_BALMU|nr:probable inactive peptidyl-prolyl cis-trans isomerase-like 6 isoform X6 [Balaenoptera musculus]
MASSSQTPPEQPLQVKVVGLFKSSSFQIAKSAAEVTAKKPQGRKARPASGRAPPGGGGRGSGRSLKSNYPSKFEDPIIVPVQEFAWDQYLQEKKRLYCDTCPKTCKNFQILCTGKAGFSQSGIRLHYTGSIFHRVVRNGWIQGGDIVAGRGDGGESIYGPTFEDENFSIPHNKRGVLGMVNKGRHSNGSQFYITLQAAPYLDRKYVAFGQLIEGTDVLHQLELVPTENERPIQQCVIIDSGELYA